MILIARRHFLLLEVLIAFVFVVGSFFPLIYPHFYIFQQQRKFIEKIEIDNGVNEFYALIIEQLHQNQISWQAMEEGTVFQIDEGFWKRTDNNKRIPFLGSYRFGMIKQKNNEKYEVAVVELILTVAPKGGGKKDFKKAMPLTYTYQIFVTRLFSKA